MTQREQDRQPHSEVLHTVRAELRRLEELLSGEGGAEQHVPAWRRPTRGEHRLPVAVAMAVAVILQLVLPDRLVFHPIWLLPAMEAVLFAVLVAANPVRIVREHPALRATGLALIGMIGLANAWSVGELIYGLISARVGEEPGPLLGSGGAIWLTNVVVFALCYWEFDRGGPVARAHARRQWPDFQFVQMDSPHGAPPDWSPTFLDYLYLSFTNATAFSPTDVMPLSRWAKMLMLVQAAVSMVTILVVVSRAVNLFK